MLNDGKKKIVYKALAFVFAVLFFSILFSNMIYDWQKSDLDYGLIEINNKSQDTKLFLNFYNTFNADKNSCDLMSKEFVGFADNVYEIGRLTSQYIENNKDVDDLKTLQKQYVFYNFELWLKLVNYNSVCDTKKNYIIYLYPYNCSECAPLASEIMDIMDDRDDVWTFSIPAEIDVKMTSVIRDYFDVDSLPGVIVNGHTLLGADNYVNIRSYLNKAPLGIEDLNLGNLDSNNDLVIMK